MTPFQPPRARPHPGGRFPIPPAGLYLFLALLGPASLFAADGAFTREVRPILQKHCIACHGGDKPDGSLDLAALRPPPDGDGDLWAKVGRKVQSGAMPPKDRPRPTAEEKSLLLAWVASLTHSVPRTTMRRLNRAEYTNTIRDLLYIDPGRGDDLPNDDVGYGFDTIGDVLSMSPLLLEKYLAYGETYARRAILIPGGLFRTVPAVEMEPKKSPLTPGGRMLAMAGQVYTYAAFPYTGEYTVTVKACGEQAGDEACLAGVAIDDRVLEKIEVPAVFPAAAAYSATVTVKKGTHKIGISFLNDFYDASEPNPKKRDRNLAVSSISIRLGDSLPYGELPQSHTALIPRDVGDGNDLRPNLARFVGRAFRRPATDREVDRLMDLVGAARRQGEGWESAMATAVSACLVNPKFLFRPEWGSPADAGPAGRALTSHELASRLSYFLWSTMPDDLLRRKADDQTLLEPKVLAAETKRMLGDGKVRSFIHDFVFQWLTLRRLDEVAPNKKLYPDWNPNLRRDMGQETFLYFKNLLDTDGPLTDLIAGEYTFMNERLSKLYGVTGITGENFRRVDLGGQNRFGILTQPGVLAITSHPSRTSPVKRGKWLLEEILGAPTPPPPPDVGALVEDAKSSEPKTLRLRLEAHRNNPACAACHDKLDPMGFALENFDVVGRYRAETAQGPIDTRGVLPDGRPVNGAGDLSRVLVADRASFIRNLAEKMLTFALGRGPTAADDKTLDGISRTVIQENFRFSSLILALVASEAFRRQGPGGTP